MSAVLAGLEPLLAPAFALWGSAVTWLEVVAFVLALATVALNIRVDPRAWPLAIASSLLYFGLFTVMLYVATGRRSWIIIGLLLVVVAGALLWLLTRGEAEWMQRYDGLVLIDRLAVRFAYPGDRFTRLGGIEYRIDVHENLTSGERLSSGVGVAVRPADVPEPGTLALAVGGLAVAAGVWRRMVKTNPALIPPCMTRATDSSPCCRSVILLPRS